MTASALPWDPEGCMPRSAVVVHESSDGYDEEPAMFAVVRDPRGNYAAVTECAGCGSRHGLGDLDRLRALRNDLSAEIERREGQGPQ